MADWGGGGNHAALVEQVKQWQRTSEGHKFAWWNFCKQQGNPKKDPALYDEWALQTFLEGTRTGEIGPTTAQADSSGDPVKDNLVQMIKNFQRQGQAQKEMWWNHCDTQLQGVRDPNRHDASTLQEFVNWCGVSGGSGGGKGGGGKGGGGKGGGGKGKQQGGGGCGGGDMMQMMMGDGGCGGGDMMQMMQMMQMMMGGCDGGCGGMMGGGCKGGGKGGCKGKGGGKCGKGGGKGKFSPY